MGRKRADGGVETFVSCTTMQRVEMHVVLYNNIVMRICAGRDKNRKRARVPVNNNCLIIIILSTYSDYYCNSYTATRASLRRQYYRINNNNILPCTSII